MKLSKAIEAFVHHLRHERKAAELTVTAYESDLNRFRFHIPMDTVLHVTPDAIRRWLAASSAEGNAMTTLHRKIATVRTFCRWGVRQGLWTASPADLVDQVKRPRQLPRPFSDDEVAALLALDLPPRETVTRALLLYTGLRVTPICGIKVGDISFAPPTIRVLVKGAKTQVIKMHPELVELLRTFITQQTDGKAFALLLRNTPMHHPRRRDVARMCARWGERAGVVTCTPHRFRHTFATKLIRSGVNPRIVKEAMGHADFSSTMLYTLVTDEDEAAAIAKLAWETKRWGVIRAELCAHTIVTSHEVCEVPNLEEKTPEKICKPGSRPRPDCAPEARALIAWHGLSLTDHLGLSETRSAAPRSQCEGGR